MAPITEKQMARAALVTPPDLADQPQLADAAYYRMRWPGSWLGSGLFCFRLVPPEDDREAFVRS